MSAVRTKVNDVIKDVPNIWAKCGDTWAVIKKGWTKAGDTWRVHYEKITLPENMIVFFTSDPGGAWNILNGVDDPLDLVTNSVYLRGDTAEGDTEYGSNTHGAPTFTGNSGVSPIVKYKDHFFGTTIVAHNNHTHTIDHSHVAINSEPPYYSLIPCKSGTLLPTTAVLFVDGSVPAGWSSIFGAIGDNFVKCGDTAGDTGGDSSHQHSYSEYSGYSNVGTTLTYAYAGAGLLNRTNHRHTINHTHPAVSNYPEWYGLIPISPDSEVTEIPSDVVAFFTGSDVPDGWTLFGAMSGGKFIRLQAASGGTGGVNDHTHSHSGSSGSYDGPNAATGSDGSGYSGDAHTHTINHPHGSADNIPLHRSLLVCKKD